MTTITRNEARLWIRWLSTIQTATGRSTHRNPADNDAMVANVTANQLMQCMLAAFVDGADVQTQPELELAQ